MQPLSLVSKFTSDKSLIQASALQSARLATEQLFWIELRYSLGVLSKLEMFPETI